MQNTLLLLPPSHIHHTFRLDFGSLTNNSFYHLDGPRLPSAVLHLKYLRVMRSVAPLEGCVPVAAGSLPAFNEGFSLLVLPSGR